MFFVFYRKYQNGFRLSFLWATLVWALAAVAMVEIFSAFQGLTKGNVILGWALMVVVAIAVLNKSKFFETPLTIPPLFKNLSVIEIIFISLTGLNLLIVGIVAWCAAPNNWDSMTYHLPRVMHWIQNHSVSHYPTHILRQLYQPPGAEFLILHFQILTGADHFANMIQWMSMLGSVVVLSLIAAELGADRKGQILTGLLSVTIPMGILQGSSTQNDFVAGFWFAGFVYFLLRLIKKGNSPYDGIGAGVSIGLAILTKGTIYVFVAPWVIFFLIAAFKNKRKDLWKDCLVIALICLTINAGHYVRNIKLFGKPLSSGSEDYVSKGNILSTALVNSVSNLAIHLGTPDARVNEFMKEKINDFHTLLLGRDGEKTTWGEFDIPKPSANEDTAGNPWHLILIVTVFVLILFARRRKADQPVRAYIFMVISAFLLFCILFKWQLFHSRLHLPLFLLSMPILGLVLAEKRYQIAGSIIVLILALTSIPPLFANERRPLIAKKNILNTKRIEQYFAYRKFMFLPYLVTAEYVGSRGVNDVGLVLGGDDWEYPLQALLYRKKPMLRVHHVDVKNISNTLARPEAVHPKIIVSELEGQPDVITVNGVTYQRTQQFSFMNIYENHQL